MVQSLRCHVFRGPCSIIQEDYVHLKNVQVMVRPLVSLVVNPRYRHIQVPNIISVVPAGTTLTPEDVEPVVGAVQDHGVNGANGRTGHATIIQFSPSVGRKIKVPKVAIGRGACNATVHVHAILR